MKKYLVSERFETQTTRRFNTFTVVKMYNAIMTACAFADAYSMLKKDGEVVSYMVQVVEVEDNKDFTVILTKGDFNED